MRALAHAQLFCEIRAQRVRGDIGGLDQPLLAIGSIGDHDHRTARGALGIDLASVSSFTTGTLFPKFAGHHSTPTRTSEKQRGTGNYIIIVPLLDIEFLTVCAARTVRRLQIGWHYSTFSTNTRMVPPQDRPTFHAVSSATPNSSIFGCAARDHIERLGDDRAPSTQPPDTEPKNVPSSLITRLEPAGRGADPQVSTTVARRHAMTGLLPALSGLQNIFITIEHGRLFQAAGSNQRCGDAATAMPKTRAAISPSIELKLCTGRNSSTCGSIILMPCALASKPP